MTFVQRRPASPLDVFVESLWVCRNESSDVTAAVGLSEKRFIERFKSEVGVTPKRYCRLLRFQQVVATAHALRDADWADVAVSCGYTDQAHLIHEFREFSGMTPGTFTRGRTAFQNHVSFLQS